MGNLLKDLADLYNDHMEYIKQLEGYSKKFTGPMKSFYEEQIKQEEEHVKTLWKRIEDEMENCRK